MMCYFIGMVYIVFLAAVVTVAAADSSDCDNIVDVATRDAIVKEHNEARKGVNPPAKVMPMLTWSCALAKLAQAHADKCDWGHSERIDRINKAGFAYVGENIAQGTALSNDAKGAKLMVDLFNKEKADFTYPTCASGKICGHYTQNIWADTTHVGCGFNKCNNKNYWVCNYGPGGNIGGKKPYEAAEKQEPNGNPQGPNGNPQGPNGNPQEPNGNPQEPNGNPQEPNGNPQEPNGNPQEPNGNPQEPNGNPQEPNGNPQGPNKDKNNAKQPTTSTAGGHLSFVLISVILVNALLI